MMFFFVLNQHQRSIAGACALVLAIIQIVMDAWTLHKIQQHEELILFLSGNSIPSTVMHDMTYEQALSYFSKLKQFLSKDLLDVLHILKTTTVLGLTAGILQLFSSTAAVLWKGTSLDVAWLIANLIVSVLLSVAVSYISIHMIRDVPYHQVLLTVTAVNLFILVHIWVINMIALIYGACFSKKGESSESSSRSNSQSETESQTSQATNQSQTNNNERNTQPRSNNRTRTVRITSNSNNNSDLM